MDQEIYRYWWTTVREVGRCPLHWFRMYRSNPFQEHRETFLASGTLTIPEGGRYCRIWGVGGGNYIASPNVGQWKCYSGGESTIGNLTFAPPLIRVGVLFEQKTLEKERHKYNVAYCDVDIPTSTGWYSLKLSDYLPNCPQEWIDAEICKSAMYRTSDVCLLIGYSVHDVWFGSWRLPRSHWCRCRCNALHRGRYHSCVLKETENATCKYC